jgi:hypothetical protein
MEGRAFIHVLPYFDGKARRFLWYNEPDEFKSRK